MAKRASISSNSGGGNMWFSIIFNILFTVVLGYSMIKYTTVMSEHPSCSNISEQKRQLIYLMGVVSIAYVIFNIIMYMLF